MIVYRALNTANGKSYIGITTQGLPKRKKEHYARMERGERQHKFYKALRKYGFDVFEWEQIDTADTLQDLAMKEVIAIQKYDAYRNGYNCNCGGGITSDETRELISRKLKNRLVTWGGKTRATRLERGNYGTQNASKGHDNPASKSYLVGCPGGTQVIVKGLRAFCRDNGLSHNLMLAVANGTQTHHKRYTCYHSEPSTTIPRGSTPQAFGGGNGERPAGAKI